MLDYFEIIEDGLEVQNKADSEYKMVNVASKKPTRRTCLASGKLIALPSTIEKIKSGKLPKGNVLPLAEAAGIMAVKNTSAILPLCHPLPIDAASIFFEFGDNFVKVFCETTAFAKTGVEMEALNGASAALLCVYDLTKGVDPALEISDLHLLRKSGGKSGEWAHPKNAPIQSTPPSAALLGWSGIRFSVITLSDRCAQGKSEDLSGPALVDFGLLHGGELVEHKLIPDDARLLKEVLVHLTESQQNHLILCTGGTGLSPRDITPDTLFALGAKLVPGIGELTRKEGARHTPYAWLSRSEAFLLKQSLVICLPGSVKAVNESVEAFYKIIPHAIHTLRGGHHS